MDVQQVFGACENESHRDNGSSPAGEEEENERKRMRGEQ